ncbi:hypothetical protein [Sporisorium scitamineum]|uniref:Fork-head domain-containing protein n=1 Tax=Sporisorium scitamineum TaxID=49012 RepID=A0A0F7RZD1_9BASI|nr:hypothetical protein [Sporisorium scitamineum]
MTTPSHPRSFGSSAYPPASSSSDYSPTSTSTPFATPATRATSIAPSTFSRSGPGNRRAKFAMLTSNAADESPLQAIHASPTPTGSRSATPVSMDDSAAVSSAKDDASSSSASTSLTSRPAARPAVRARPTASAASTSTGSPLTSSTTAKFVSSASTTTRPGTTTTPSSSANAAASGSTASPAMTKDAEDFFARAQAMGLRLTREDYERTKAGVAAFLKAERRPFTPTATTSAASTSTSASKDSGPKAASSSQSTSAPAKTSSSTESSVDAAKMADAKSNTSQPRLTAPLPLTRPGGPSWSRNTSSPGLSFFTAIIEPQDSPGSPKVHPSLDQVGNAEERRRLKLKKQKLRQRPALAAASSSSKALHDLLTTPNSTVAQSSPEAGSSSAFRTPPTRTHAKKSSCSSIRSVTRVGLGLDLNGSDSTTSPDPSTPPEGLSSAFSQRRSRGRTVSFEASPVVRVTDEVRECSSLEELSRRAWVSPRGTLRLLKSPIEHDAVFCSPPVDVDDSGVCFSILEPASSAAATRSGGLAADGWGAAHRRTLSAGSNGTVAPNNLESLDAKMSGLSFLDRIMSKQTSPRRLYKAEKLRQKEAIHRKVVEEQVKAQLAAQQVAEEAARAEYEQKEAVKAAAAADAIKAANPDYASPVLSTPDIGSKTRKSPDSVVRATPLESSSSRALRWTTIGASPGNMHTRMTTREHYDFTMHGISPSQPGYDSLDTLCNIHSTPGPITFHAWDAEPLTSLRKGTDAHRSHVRGSSAITPAAHLLLSADEHRPELIGVSPSVAGFFHARQSSAQASANSSLMRASSQDVAILSPLSGRLVSGVASRMSDLDFDADDDIGVHHEDANNLGKPSAFNAKRGLLFSAPGGTALDPPPSSLLAEAVQLDDGAGKGFTLPTSSPMRLGRSLRAGTAGDEMIGGKLPFASPRSALVRAQSGTTIDTRHNCQPSGNIRDFLGSGTSGSKHKRGLSRKIDTISPADVFGSSLPRTVSAPNVDTRQPLPEPSKGARDAADAPLAESRDDSQLVSMQNRNKKGKKAAEARRVQSDSPPSPSKQLTADKTARHDSDLLMQPPAELPGVAVNTMTQVGSGEPVMTLFAAKGPEQLAVDASQPSSTKKTKKAKAAVGSASDSAVFKVVELPCQDFERMAQATPSVQNGDEIGWDQPDGSRLVKLVSEELKAALDAGTLVEEPAARYYLLPPGFGQSKAKPSSVSYAGLIGQAIKSSSDMRLSLSEVYDWISSTYPFFEKGDRGWQNSIRHNLSLNKSFIKIEREANMPGKGGWWGIKPGHEDRFQNGLYNAANKVMDSPDAVEKALSAPDADTALPSSQRGESVDDSAKKRSKAKRKKAQAGDAAADSGDESDKESGRPLSSKKVKLADRLPLLETQPQSGGAATLGGAAMAINGIDSITPVRPHVGSSVYSSSLAGSSLAGSSYSKTIPGLVDSASSPPSSPLTLMPPPSIQATANHSARKRKLAGQGNGQLGYGSGFSPSLYAMRGSALGGAFAFSNGMDSDTSRGSPLRRQTKGSTGGDNNASQNSSVTSPKRLWSISSPMSSMRGQKGQAEEGMRSPTSTARVAAALARSPIRSSPLRSGAAGMLSPNSSASLQMQLAMGGGAGQMGFNGAGFGAGLGMGSGLAPGGTPGSLRFASGMSPGRRGYSGHGQMMGMSLAGAAPQNMQQAWYLDDPFEMQANLAQQHQHQQMVQHHQIHAQPGHGGIEAHYAGFGTEGLPASPLRQAWNSIQAAGGIQAFTGGHGFSQARQ